MRTHGFAHSIDHDRLKRWYKVGPLRRWGYQISFRFYQLSFICEVLWAFPHFPFENLGKIGGAAEAAAVRYFRDG